MLLVLWMLLVVNYCKGLSGVTNFYFSRGYQNNILNSLRSKRSCTCLGKGKPRNPSRIDRDRRANEFWSREKWGERKKWSEGEGESRRGPFLHFPLPLASFFALSPFFARPKLVRSPVSMDFWVFLSLKTHRNP